MNTLYDRYPNLEQHPTAGLIVLILTVIAWHHFLIWLDWLVVLRLSSYSCSWGFIDVCRTSTYPDFLSSLPDLQFPSFKRIWSWLSLWPRLMLL